MSLCVDSAGPVPDSYRFDRCELRPYPPYLLRDGKPVAVTGQVLALLRLLVSRPGEVVSKSDLLDEVWGHSHLSDAALARAVMRTRQAIGDDGREQRLIRTVHGKGLVFAAPVAVTATALPDAAQSSEPVADPAVEPAAGAPPRRYWRIVALILALVLTVTLAWWASLARLPPGQSAPSERLAVVQRIDAAAEDEELSMLAAALPGLLAERMAGAGLRLMLAGEHLELGGERAWRSKPDRLRALFGASHSIAITLSRKGGVPHALIETDGADGIAGTELTGPITRLADASAAWLAARLAGWPLQDRGVSRADDSLLDTLVLRARAAWARSDGTESLKALHAALALEPDNPRLRLMRIEMEPRGDQSPRALARSLLSLLDDPALELTPLERAMVLQRAGVHAWYGGEVEDAVELLQESLALSRDLDAPVTTALARNALSMALQSVGRADQAWEYALQAVDALRARRHPFHLAQALTNLGYLAEDRGRLEAARDWHREALQIREAYGFDRQVSASQYALARVLRRSGELSEAERLLASAARQMEQSEQTMELTSALEEQAVIATLAGRHAEAEARIERAAALARSGDDRLGLAWLDDVRGRLRLAQGRTDEAIELLRGSVQAQLAEGEVHEVRYTRIALLDALWRRSAHAADATDATDAEATGLETSLMAEAASLPRDQRIALAVVQLRRQIAEGDVHMAQAGCDRTLALARDAGTADHEAEAAFLCASVRARNGDSEGAERLRERARSWNQDWYAARERSGVAADPLR